MYCGGGGKAEAAQPRGLQADRAGTGEMAGRLLLGPFLLIGDTVSNLFDLLKNLLFICAR